MHSFYSRRLLAALAVLLLLPAAALACPFCSAVSQTFSEEIGTNDVAVFAKLVYMPERSKDAIPTLETVESGKATFEIVKVLKGAEKLGNVRQFETIYFGDQPVGTTFLVMGIEPPNMSWNTPIAMTERSQEYITKAMELPKEGPDRLAFFQDYFEDPEELLARDAYDEFAKAPFAAVKGLKGRMNHAKLVEWIKNPQVLPSRRRLYLTLLAVENDPRDIPMLEEMITAKESKPKAALDALIAAYLTLKGAEGMPLIEDLYLKNQDAEFTDTLSAIMAIRFHGQEETIIPRERLLVGLRYILDRPKLADTVIADLARWEDWSVMDKLVKMFKSEDEELMWVRVPVINYLKACPLPEAKAHIDELAKIDPKAVKQAETLFSFGAGALRSGDPARDAAAGNAGENQQPPAANESATGTAPAEETEKPQLAPTDKSSATPAEASKPAKATDKPQAAADGGKSGAAAASQAGVARLTTDASVLKTNKGQGAATSTWRVLGGLVLALGALGFVFTAILRGGQRAAAPSSSR